MSDVWLPTGGHYDLNIEHHQLEDAGDFAGGGRKLVWHTTESERETVDVMVGVLSKKRAAPHFVIGTRKGFHFPVVIQTIPLDKAGRALMHPSGPETNRANAIQVEICGRAAESFGWEKNWYKALANLAILIGHRVPIPEVAPRAFPGRRYTGKGFYTAKGHVGHCHVPGNDHTDPGHFRAGLLLGYVKQGQQQVDPS